MAAPRDEERLTSLRNLVAVTGALAGLGGIAYDVLHGPDADTPASTSTHRRAVS